MSATIWFCECGAKYELPDTTLGRKVRCKYCGAVSRVEQPSSINAPPPLPKASVPSREGSGKSSIRHGLCAAELGDASTHKRVEQSTPIRPDLVLEIAQQPPAPRPPTTSGTLTEFGRYSLATVVCGAIFLLYAFVCGAFGWKHGGGAIPMLMFLGAMTAAWKAITGSGRRRREQVPKSPSLSNAAQPQRPAPAVVSKSETNEATKDIASPLAPKSFMWHTGRLFGRCRDASKKLNGNYGLAAGIAISGTVAVILISSLFHAFSGTSPVSQNVADPNIPVLAELVGPSVVQVNVTGPKKAGTGSGFVLDKQGTIVTNYHVIEDATAGTIVFSDRTSAPIAGYLGVWPEKDIALIRVECPQDKLHPLRLATALPRQGERVAAFGSPLGLQQSVSEGIVSAMRASEELQTLVPINLNALLIQNTTPISRGNSGGPLVDMKGMVVGVNTMGLQILGGENLNFAVAMAELPPLLLAKSEIASPLPFRDPTVNEVERIVKRAKDHFDAGDYDSAIADYTKAIRLSPKYASAFERRGTVYQIKGDDESAIADFKKVIRLDPAHVGARQSLGFIYQARKDYDSAIAEFAYAIRLDPTNSLNHFERGQCYRETMDYDRAIADYTEAIRLYPKDADAFTSRGDAYREKGDYDRAIADYTEAIRLDPKNAYAYAVRGWVYARTKEFDSAIADNTEAIRLDPTNASNYFHRGLDYSSKGDIDRAIADLSNAIRLDRKDADAYDVRAGLYFEKYDYDRAIADYTEAIRLKPKNATSYHGRGTAYALKRDCDSAVADFTQVIRLDPKDASAYFRRGWAYELKGQKAIAKRDFEQATKLGYALASPYYPVNRPR